VITRAKRAWFWTAQSARRVFWHKWLLVAAIVVLVAVGGVAAAAYGYDRSQSDMIAKGIRVGAINIGGLSASEARSKLRRVYKVLERPLHLRYRGWRLVLIGREARVRVDVDALVDKALERSCERVRIGRLLARFGELLFEPWVDRVQDMACAGIVHSGGVRLFPPHLLDNDPRGVFRAAIIDEGSSLASEHRDALRSTAAAAGEALADAGYLGPFSIDAYTWRDRSGALHLQPMSEINARLTFGILGHALP